ncbi:MAG: hypothetical protein FWE05_05915 [Defluviitaleaceae bacterium]|nr:hypothetical protein [Defluviitaleaceae bacterium]
MPRTGEIDVSVFLNKQRKKKVPVLNKAFDYVSPKDYSKIVKSHPVTIYGLLSAGSIEGAVKVGRHWKIPVGKAEACTPER